MVSFDPNIGLYHAPRQEKSEITSAVSRSSRLSAHRRLRVDRFLHSRAASSGVGSGSCFTWDVWTDET